jgi:hypothetical protein
MVRLTVRGTRSPVILLEGLRLYEDRVEPKCAVITACSSRPQASPVRALFTQLSHPAFPGEQGEENGVADQRGAGRRVATRRDATGRAADACKAPEA